MHGIHHKACTHNTCFVNLSISWCMEYPGQFRNPIVSLLDLPVQLKCAMQSFPKIYHFPISCLLDHKYLKNFSLPWLSLIPICSTGADERAKFWQLREHFDRYVYASGPVPEPREQSLAGEHQTSCAGHPSVAPWATASFF